jgi:hypothetical protein
VALGYLRSHVFELVLVEEDVLWLLAGVGLSQSEILESCKDRNRLSLGFHWYSLRLGFEQMNSVSLAF